MTWTGCTYWPFWSFFFILHALYVGLIVFAAVNMGKSSAPMPLTYDPAKDILLDAGSITVKSTTGVRVVNDEEASSSRAIEFLSGANERAEAQPEVFIEMRFSAAPGPYVVWLRGKTDINNVFKTRAFLTYQPD